MSRGQGGREPPSKKIMLLQENKNNSKQTCCRKKKTNNNSKQKCCKKQTKENHTARQARLARVSIAASNPLRAAVPRSDAARPGAPPSSRRATVPAGSKRLKRLGFRSGSWFLVVFIWISPQKKTGSLEKGQASEPKGKRRESMGFKERKGEPGKQMGSQWEA